MRILSKIIKFFKKACASFQIIKVHSLYEEGSFHKAIDILNTVNKKCPGLKKVAPDYYILLGQLYYEVKQIELSVDNFFEALHTIGDIHTLNEDEKKYLIMYVFQWLDFLSQYNLENVKKINIEKKHEGKDVVINPNNISYSLKNYFPLDYEREINISMFLET